MKVTKPMKLGVLLRSFEQARRGELHVGVILGFQLDSPRSLLDEMSLWAAATPELGPTLLDEGLAKPSGEFLVAGRCFAARGEPTTASYVRAQIGALEKRLAVIGNRQWRRGAQSTPEPFVEMQIDWRHAFGGPEYPLNPYGLGIAPGSADGVVPLPNVELYSQMVRTAGDRPQPGAFGAMDPSFGARRSLAGTFGFDYVEKWAPGLPPDHKPGFFNLAPIDQRIPAFWSGTEHFVVENMSPGNAKVSGSLPGLTARAFAAQRTGGEVRFHEIGLACETVWLFPSAGIGALIFRGRLAVADDDAADVEHLVLACEEIGRPRPIDHYVAARLRRLDKDKCAIAEISDSDLMPGKDSGVAANISFGELGMWTRAEGLGRANAERGARRDKEEARRKIVEAGQDPSFLDQDPAPPELPDFDDLDAVASFMAAQADRSEEHFKEDEDLEAEIAADVKKAAEAVGKDPSEIMPTPPETGGGPFEFTAESVLRPMRETAAEARASGSRASEVEAQLEDPKLLAQLAQNEKDSLAMYRSSTHLGPAAAPMTEEAAQLARVVVETARDVGVSLAERDFTGANFRAQNLGGMDFRGAFFEGADMRDADLAGADLTGAVLAHADLRGASLRNAKLAGANLGGANLEGAVFDGADLKKAVLARARTARARFDGANLTDADLMEARLGGADFSGVTLETGTFIKADLSNTSFARARLYRSTFIECVLDGCDFSEANLEKVTIVTSKGRAVRFVRARMDEAVLAYQNQLPEADFTEASLERACLRTTGFAHARFTRARMTMSDLSECDATGAAFDQAILNGALLIRTNLDRASLADVNLTEAILSKSKLAGADFSRAQLTRADFLRARGDANTSFADATVKFTRFDAESSKAQRS